MKPDKFGCLGPTIKVASGHYFNLAEPDSETVDIESIASALSKICRFGGHCPRFYSVAEHCCRAATEARKDGIEGLLLKAIFLHDAAEAYAGDMVKPLKLMLPEYSEIEQRIEEAIARRFRVPFSDFDTVIEKYDRLMLKAEKMAMWPDDREQWSGFGEIEDREVELHYWEPPVAEASFLEMAHSIGLADEDDVSQAIDRAISGYVSSKLILEVWAVSRGYPARKGASC